jgi:hypothetical protein
LIGVIGANDQRKLRPALGTRQLQHSVVSGGHHLGFFHRTTKKKRGSERVRIPISIILLDPDQLSELIDLDKSIETFPLHFKGKFVEHWEVSNFIIFYMFYCVGTVGK